MYLLCLQEREMIIISMYIQGFSIRLMLIIQNHRYLYI